MDFLGVHSQLSWFPSVNCWVPGFVERLLALHDDTHHGNATQAVESRQWWIANLGNSETQTRDLGRLLDKRACYPLGHTGC